MHALAILRLYHRVENLVAGMQAMHARDVDRLTHALESTTLRSEVQTLSLRRSTHESQIRDLTDQLQTATEQLQSLPSKRR